jgi:hypothetical protein
MCCRPGDVIILRNIVPLPLIRPNYSSTAAIPSPQLAALLPSASLSGPIPAQASSPMPGNFTPTNRWGNDYRIPIGENLAGTGPNQRNGFTFVGLNVQAVEDGTRWR